MRALLSCWLALWTTYCTVASVLPRAAERFRRGVNLTYKDLYYNMAKNIGATLVVLPIISYIPSVYPYQGWIAAIIKYILTAIVADLWFYTWHRLMHHPKLYHYHRQHHEYYHPSALGGLYCSTTEMILVNQLSIAVPFQLFNYSQTEMVVASIIVALNVIKGHAGLHHYGNVGYLNGIEHELHHEEMTVNYGVMYLVDRVLKTYKNIKKVETGYY